MRFELLLQKTAERHPDKQAIVEWDGLHWQTISFQSLLKQSHAFATQLQKNNLKPGERVILISHNRIQSVVALLGIWIAKGTVVLIDPDLPESALLNQVAIADARFVVSEEALLETITQKMQTPFLILIQDNQLTWQEHNNLMSKTVDDDCDIELATIIFTSGTTGDYKGVMLTHANFIYLTQFYHNLSPHNGCSLTVLPLFHVAGLFCGFLQPLFLGVEIVIFRILNAEALQTAFSNYKPTVIISVPRLLDMLDQKIKIAVKEQGIFAKIIFYFLLNSSYFFNRYLKINLGELFFKSLRARFGGRLKKILCGSAHLPISIQKHFLSFGFEVLLSYGLTETCGPITLTSVKHRWKFGNVGPCVDQNDLKILSSGEIVYRGNALMKGYFRDKNATDKAIHDGFFHTRDLGRLDKAGNLYILGRIKELIVFSDGKKAMPEQIEKQYALVLGIKEFAVFSAGYSDAPIAVLAFVSDEKESKKIIQDVFQKASSLKSPFRISDVMRVDVIPRSSTLKVKRHELREQYENQKEKASKLTNEIALQSDAIKNIIICFQSVLADKKVLITANSTFAELGIDSLLSVQLCEMMRAKLGLVISPTAFWFSHNIRELTDYLYSEKIMPSKPVVKKTQNHIAIIAAECIFPEAPDVTTFWANLMAGKDVITTIPVSRWNNHDYYDPYPLAPGKTNSNQGGFINLPDDFPFEAFGIKPRIASSMDPQQKILLMVAKKLLAHQRINNVGCFIGAGFPDFMIEQIKSVPLTQTNPYSGVGMADFSLSARIAFHFGLTGPAMVIKTACSSALVAVHQAVRALQTNDCDMAIAGGINLIQAPDISVCLTKGGFLSPEGRCKTFDATANGYVRSEGCGLVLLKRYDDAVSDHDKILSVIVGSSINQDGASNGITAPNGKSQVACYQKALENAALSPDHISFIESHGSGTQLGDAIEMQSIQAVYDQNRHNTLYVGAVKSVIGHCESAAGIAGLIKTIYVLNHQMIPPNLHYHQPNPHISFEKSSLCLPQKAMHFEKPCEYAAVSSFGVAGTNVHMILGLA